MSKKKKATSKAKGKKSGNAGSRRFTTPKAPKTRKSLKQPALPGTEGVRIKSLDSICEEIGEGRDISNRVKREEKGLVNRALKIMEAKSGGKEMVYTHAKVVLSLEPGGMKLRVRTLKDGDATANAGAQFEEALGEGQEPANIADALTPDDERLAEEGDDEQGGNNE